MIAPSHSPSAALAPAPMHSASERIGVLDVLRGIALLGMFVVHFGGYAADALDADTASRPTRLLATIVSWFFDGRFYAMFGMLFGIGFAVQLRRADVRGERFVARFLRRLAALAVFGLIAEGVFGYNVLLGYAIWAVPLLLVRRWPIRALVVVTVLCAASPPIYNLARLATLGPERMNVQNQAQGTRFGGARTQFERAEEARDWGTVVEARLRFMPEFHRQWSRLPNGSFTLFLLGLIAFRLGLFDHPEAHRRKIVALMVAGCASWALSMWVFPIGPPAPRVLPATTSVGDLAGIIARSNAFRLIRDQWLAFTYIGAVLLLVAHTRDWLRRLAAFAWTGRMALTNYMTQVILLDTLFTPHGFDLTVAPIMVPVYAVTLFAAQAALSKWWLARYRLGPLEWIWRSITYWRWQPFRIAPPVVPGVIATA